MSEVRTVGELLDQLPAPKLPPEPGRDLAVHQGPLLSAIVALAKDPAVDVTKLQALLEMQERMEEREAKREFIAAFTRLSAVLPRVKKNGTISLIAKDGTNKGDIPFAKWEDMDKVIRPLYTKEGFTLSFDSVMRPGEGGGLIVTGTLMHRDGHTRTASMPLPLDTGPGRNNLQAGGSTLSYGKRYCAEMLLNIVREGADKDGSEDMELISNEQKEELVTLLAETKRETRAFLEYVFPRSNIRTLDEIPAARFPDAKAALERVKATLEKKAGKAPTSEKVADKGVRAGLLD